MPLVGAKDVEMIKVTPDSRIKDFVSDVVQEGGPALKVPMGILGQQDQGGSFLSSCCL